MLRRFVNLYTAVGTCAIAKRRRPYLRHPERRCRTHHEFAVIGVAKEQYGYGTRQIQITPLQPAAGPWQPAVERDEPKALAVGASRAVGRQEQGVWVAHTRLVIQGAVM